MIRDLTAAEKTTLEIIEGYDHREIAARDLRMMLRNRGFKKSAPAFYMLMANLEDAGLVEYQDKEFPISGVSVKRRYYRLKGK